MPQPFTLHIEGFNQLGLRIKDMPKKLQKEIGGEILASAQEIHHAQLRAVRVNTGRLKQGLPEPVLKDLQTELTSSALYSPYVEFGTGKLVSVPKGLEDFAIQFKGAGIREVNLPARPFFFPPYILERPRLLKNIDNVLKDL